MKTITEKSWKEGTYVHTTYYVDGEEFKTISEHKNQCSVEYFNNLPESEENAEMEDITDNTPSWLDDMIEVEEQ
jgi:hypothetical protein